MNYTPVVYEAFMDWHHELDYATVVKFYESLLNGVIGLYIRKACFSMNGSLVGSVDACRQIKCGVIINQHIKKTKLV